MDRIVHFILYSSEKILCNLTIQRIINRRGINVCNFLIKPAFAGTDFLYLRNQMIKIIFAKNLTIDQSFLVQNISLFCKRIQYFGCPLTELDCSDRVYTISHCYDCGQRIEFVLISLSILRSMCKFCTYCMFIQLATGKNIFQMFCYHAPVHIKQLANCLLCQPYIAILDTHLNPFLAGIFGKNKKIDRTVAYLKFIFFLYIIHFFCHVNHPSCHFHLSSFLVL